MTVARPVVAVTRRMPERVLAALEASCEVVGGRDDTPATQDELAEMLVRADGILCTVTDSLPAALFGRVPPRARILANFGVGVNHIDLAAVRASGIRVSNTPDQLSEATADLTLGLMLMTLRRLGEGERRLRAGKWEGWGPTDFLGHDLYGRRLGLIGFGRIGQAVARRAALGFGMTVKFHTRTRWATDDVPPFVEQAESLEALLADSEIVSLHLPATPETRNLFDEPRLRLIPRGGWLINTARGTIVDEAALVRVLADGHLAGAGLDVFEREPVVTPELLAFPGVALLPHMGSATVAAREAMGMRAVANLLAFFAGQPLLDPVA
ncbi:MAG: D-glycerate dehydrogenase [Gemmatimonadota bacterium]|nr:D-glycerate dehydrogenase [Gemmatimonadota bacterium]